MESEGLARGTSRNHFPIARPPACLDFPLVSDIGRRLSLCCRLLVQLAVFPLETVQARTGLPKESLLFLTVITPLDIRAIAATYWARRAKAVNVEYDIELLKL